MNNNTTTRIFSALILTFLITTEFVSAQKTVTDANVVGDVQCNGKHIPFISVFVKGTTLGTITDHTGHFQLVNLPEGEHTLVAKGVGYRSSETTVMIRKNTTREIKFKLEEDILNLEGVVVTADRHGTSRKDAAVVVNTITPKMLESTQAISIATGMDFVPGLRMECNCQNCGFSQVRMNGMDGPYSQILINSRPVFSGLAGVYGLELIPASMVDRIEVVRGGGSALFGGNAIAGTINILTKVPEVNSFNVEGRYGLMGVGNSHEAGQSADRLINLNGSVVTDDLKSGMSFFGMIRDREPFDENGDGFSEMVSMNNTTFGLNAFHKVSKKSKLSLDLYRINEFRRGGNKFDYLPHEADIAEQVDHRITGANLAYDLFTNGDKSNKLMLYAAGQSVHRDSYYGAEQDPDAYGNTYDITASLGGQFYMHLNDRSTLLMGIDDNFNKLEDMKLGAAGMPNSLIVDQFTNTIGSFAQYEWHTEMIKASLGLRFDSYLIRDFNDEDQNGFHKDITGNVLAPRMNILVDISDELQFRTAYSKGYRTPQIFDEDLHIESSGSRRIIHVNDPDLHQESSHTITPSLRYTHEFGSVSTELLVEGFYTRLLNPFAYDYTFVDSTETLITTRNNAADGAFVSGVNLEFNAALPHPQHVTLQTGFTFQTSQYDNPQAWGEKDGSLTKYFLRTPGSYGYLTVEWEPAERFSASFTSNYTGRMHVPHLGLDPITGQEWEMIDAGNLNTLGEDRQKQVEAILNGDVIEGERLEHSERFLIFGMRLAYDIPLSGQTNMQVYTGVQNIFNQTQQRHDSGIYRDAGYIYGPCQPRMFNVGLKVGNIW